MRTSVLGLKNIVNLSL
jgi:predicted transcriptional regulator